MLNRVSTPAGLAVYLDDLKLALRIHHSDDDATLAALVRGETKRYEDFTGRIMLPAEFEMKLACWPDEIRFLVAPVAAIASVKYLDEADADQTVDPGLYEFVPSEAFARLRFTDAFTGPTLSERQEPVTIRFTAGYQDLNSPQSGWPAYCESDELDRRNIVLLVGRRFDQGKPMPESEMRSIMGNRRLFW